MKKHDEPPRLSIDGLTMKRRAAGKAADAHAMTLGKTELRPHERSGNLRSQTERSAAVSSKAPEVLPQATAPSYGGLKRSDIDQSLEALDNEPPVKKKRVRRFRKISKKKVALVLLLLVVLAAGYFVFKFVVAGGRVFSGNVFDLLGSGVQLKQDTNGRTNILVFGTSEDDPGHSGANLTDSIMVLSLDQEKKNAAMVSVPRDLWVDYGEACLSGYSGKINVVYACGEENGGETVGSQRLMDKVGEVFGLDIQYYAHVNYSVVRDTVDAVGGVSVLIDSDDPRGIMDRNMDWTCQYRCYLVKWPNGTATLNGEQALALARARGEGAGYGLGGGNFDREKYQQRIMVALRDKALSAGTLANPIAVNGLMDALGNNLRTNFTAAEIKTLTELATEVKNESIRSISLVSEDHPIVTTGMYSGQSIVRPIAGIDDFSDIQAYIKQHLQWSELSGENESLEVLNASTMSGVAAKEQTVLEKAGFVNITVGDTSFASSGDVTWYDMAAEGTMPKTRQKLIDTYGKASGTTLPTGVQSDADFVILVGNGTY